ncbi:MAG: hypothetical protein KDD85_11995 [Parvularculaceae bacterium]|nr:hypothetical protein [Parvularculaceae bacterium]
MSALSPFFWFNCRFAFVAPMLNGWMPLGISVNAAMLALCVIGCRARK